MTLCADLVTNKNPNKQLELQVEALNKNELQLYGIKHFYPKLIIF